MARFVLLDRDGVINRKIQNGYVTSWGRFVFLPGALDALRLFHAAGYLPLVISNQAGVGKGLMTAVALDQITARFKKRVEAAGGRIERVYYCTHAKEAHCGCRKPRPGLLIDAERDYHFCPAVTYFIGDSPADILAASRMGCPAILISKNPPGELKACEAKPRAVVSDLKAAAEFILAGAGLALPPPAMTG
ncbi:MAG: HAD family hydrolase [Acidobacteriota bacterium]|nr:HAD family hydrolase [Acidobacteriota bacterium]